MAIASRKDQIISLVQKTQDSGLVLATTAKRKTSAIARNPHFQVVTISTASCTVTLGAVGGAFGCMGGVVVGSAVGVVPALLTFGLSIPLGAAVGGGVGLSAGAGLGGFSGACAGAAAGHGVYVWRAEIRNGVLMIRDTTTRKAHRFKVALTSAGVASKSFASKKTNEALVRARTTGRRTKELALDSASKAQALAKTKSFQVTTASAAAGAAAGGTAGAAAGTLAGAGVGAMVGLPAALFTFGLSIPVCATIGGGVGCVTGATGGGAVGGASAAAVGYSAHKYHNEIAGGVGATWSNVRSRTGSLKVKAISSVSQARALVSGTGGTSVH